MLKNLPIPCGSSLCAQNWEWDWEGGEGWGGGGGGGGGGCIPGFLASLFEIRARL